MDFSQYSVYKSTQKKHKVHTTNTYRSTYRADIHTSFMMFTRHNAKDRVILDLRDIYIKVTEKRLDDLLMKNVDVFEYMKRLFVNGAYDVVMRCVRNKSLCENVCKAYDIHITDENMIQNELDAYIKVQ